MRRYLLMLFGFSAVHAQPSPETLIEQGHVKRARAIVAAKLAANPNDAEVLYLMSWIKQGLGDAAGSQQLAEKAVAAAPNVAKYHYRLAEAVGEQAQKASTLRQIGLGRRFKKEVDATLALDPKHVGALNLTMQVYLQAPGILGGDKKKAHEIPSRIAAVDPVKGVMAEIALARFDKQQDRVEGLYRKAVELRPGSYEARTALASFLLNSDAKHAPEVERHAREALKLDATRTGAHTLLAVSLAVQGRWNEVEPALAQSEKDVPDNLTPFLRVANWCIYKGVEYPRADKYLRKYLSQEAEIGAPSWAVAHWRLGTLLEKMGRQPEAVAEYRTAVKLDGNSPAKAELKRLKA
jgi:tetratricopeptide (TPR) repeat protein